MSHLFLTRKRMTQVPLASRHSFGLVELDFTNNQLAVGEELDIAVPIDLDRNISLISTSEGDSILFYFNGLQINNGAHELAMNGNDMYPGWLDLGYNARNGSFILPMPEMDNEYRLFSTYVTQDFETLEIYSPELNVSTISTDPTVEVTVKNETVATGQFSNG